MNKEQQLQEAIKKVFGEYKYSIYQCYGCGFGQGHQIIYCPKCGQKMKQVKNISSADLGKINKASQGWNFSTLKFKVDDVTGGLMFDWVKKHNYKKNFLELVRSTLNWL